MSENEHDRDELIRRRAYQLWEQAGEPEGLHEEFWHKAEAEMVAPDDAAPDAPSEHSPRESARPDAAKVGMRKSRTGGTKQETNTAQMHAANAAM